MEGYKTKPLLIEIFALIYLLNPLGNILFLIFSTQDKTPVESFLALITFISNGNLIVILNIFLWLSAIPLAYGLYKVRLWAWYYFIIHSCSMVIISFFGNDYKIHLTYITFVNILFMLPIGYFISREIRTPYFNPKVRWWEQTERFKHEVKILLEDKEYCTFDFSEEGAFIIDNGETDLEVGELIPIKIILDKITISCFAEVRWINKELNKTYPKGFGIKYDKMKFHDKITIKTYIKMLKEVGKEKLR